MRFLFIDESGDLGPNGSKYLIIVGLLTKDFKKLDRLIKNMRRNKFKKELKCMKEIKAAECSKNLILHMLNEVNKLNCEIYCIILNKKEVPRSKYTDKNKLYDFVVGKIAKELKIDSKIEVRIDKSKGKIKDQKIFNKYFMNKINFSDEHINIYHSHSHSWSGIQFCDVLAWSYFQKYERNNPVYVNMIKTNLKVIKIKFNYNSINSST